MLTGARLERHLGHFAWTYLHVAGGSLMLFLGAANLYLGATRRAARLHRWIGRGYLAGGGLGVAAAVVLSVGPAHKTDAGVVLTNVGVSLLTLSAAWLASAVLAYRAARHRRFDSHPDWMIRNYVLIWAFVFCRIGNRVPGVEEMGDGDAFIWLSWVGPLLACEVALQWRAGGARDLAHRDGVGLRGHGKLGSASSSPGARRGATPRCPGACSRFVSAPAKAASNKRCRPFPAAPASAPRSSRARPHGRGSPAPCAAG